MGRIKTMQIKRISKRLLREHRKEITTDFQKNKKIIEQWVEIPSKKMRNVVAGYLTKLKKQEKDEIIVEN